MEADLRLLGDVDQRAGVIADDHGVACGGVLEVVERDLNTRRFCSDSSAEARSMIMRNLLENTASTRLRCSAATLILRAYSACAHNVLAESCDCLQKGKCHHALK